MIENKLLEYSKCFLEHFNSNILTSNEVSEFSNLLEVFRVKIANHAEYLKNKVEYDYSKFSEEELKQVDFYDYVIMNDDLSKIVKAIFCIMVSQY